MTEQELDRIMRRVLIDSMKAEAEQDKEDLKLSFKATSRHQRQMHAMLANPIRWLRRRGCPRWKQIEQRVAVIFLVFILFFGGMMALSPTARATVVRWFMEWYENTINYLYIGDRNTEALPQYEIAELPDGFKEIDRNTAPELVEVTYENDQGDIIELGYVFMHQGTLSGFDVEDANVFEIQVNSQNGVYFEARSPGNLNTVTWIDANQNLQFMIDGCYQCDELLRMAESVSLCKTPN